jgi:hypothetical protein
LLGGRYSASPLIRTHPPPSRRQSISRLSRLYDLPCSGDFAPGRGGLLQLLGLSLPPCCRFHPAEVRVPCRSDFDISCCLRPTEAGSALGSTRFRGHMRVHCRYGPVTRDLPRGDFVDRLQDIGFPPPCSEESLGYRELSATMVDSYISPSSRISENGPALSVGSVSWKNPGTKTT